MLGNFEIQRPNLTVGRLKSNFSDLTGITSVFLCVNDFDISLTNMLVIGNWLSAVGDEEVFPIHSIKDVTDETEAPELKDSKQGFRYQAFKGKYRFTFLLNWDVDQFIKLKNFEGQNLKAYFADKNGNMIGISDTTFKPFTLDSIIVQKITWGVYDSSYTRLSVELTDEIEDGYSFKPDFVINDIRLFEATILATTVDATTMTLTVTDECSNAVTGLVASDFTITDDISGVLTSATFTEVGGGVYTYASNENQYEGDINLVSDGYIGSTTYAFGSLPQYNPTQYDNLQYTVI